MATRWMMALAIGLLAWNAPAQDAPPVENQMEKQSYALGVELGTQLRKNSVELELDPFIQGLKDSLSGKQTLTEKEVGDAVGELRTKREKNRAALQGELGLKNAMEGQVFLAGNKVNEGVVTLGSGLQYKVLKAGDGRKPTLADTVVCHYRGTLLDGKEFDSSYKRNKPATFAVNRVIKGWSEALQLMSVGSKWQLFIPPTLAYGERSAGSLIGPNATLIFDVELISIKDTSGPGSPAAGIEASTKADVPVSQEKPDKARTADAGPPRIQLSFKLDPRLSGGTYGGERWVSPPTYMGASAQDTVEIKALGTDAQGRPVRIRPKWIASDPRMVTVSPSEGDAVKVTVKHAGQSSLQVTSPGVSKELSIKAEYKDNVIQVAIAQKQ
jgi:FKBP-type peptidyl-prolyl cis-trans isomerase FklB